MKHLSLTGDPAITCFSCSPSTDTEGTERQTFYISAKFHWWESELPTTLSLKTWLILGLVDTWHSNCPASLALVNLSLRVFCPRLAWSCVNVWCLETFINAKIRCKPDGDQLKSLVVDIFFVADEERIAVRISHPGYLALLQLKLYNLSFADFTEKNLCQ